MATDLGIIYDLSLSIIIVFMTSGPRLYVIKKAASPIMILNGGGKISPKNIEAIDTKIVIHLILGFSLIISCRRSIIVFTSWPVMLSFAGRSAMVMFFPVFPHLGQGPVWSADSGSLHHLQVVLEVVVIDLLDFGVRKKPL